MKDKIAVIITGGHDSGKTTTIKYFDKYYDADGREKAYCRIGWRQLQLFYDKLGAIFILIYFIPSSPSESNRPLKDTLKDFQPELLLIAEQIDGKEYDNTKLFLEQNDYQIEEFMITPDSENPIWRKQANEPDNTTLNQRAIEIGEKYKNFIIKRY